VAACIRKIIPNDGFLLLIFLKTHKTIGAGIQVRWILRGTPLMRPDTREFIPLFAGNLASTAGNALGRIN
jgi:hypothetical protein